MHNSIKKDINSCDFAVPELMPFILVRKHTFYFALRTV